MKTLPTLFSRTSTGAIQQWTVQIDGGKFRVESGQTDGKKVLSEWSVCESKNVGRANETTAEEQAVSEAQSKWDKKAKTGYTIDISKIDECTPYVEPMLAKDFDDYIKKTNFAVGLFVQNKYNGVRCVATFEGGVVVLKSRKGELWVAVPHINADLQNFFEKYPDAVLDGELYNYDLRQKLNQLSKIVRTTKAEKLTPALLARSEEMVRFYVYDGYGFGAGLDEENSYSDRKTWIDANLPKWSKYYRKVDTKRVTSMVELDKLYNSFLADGEEGAIIRFPNSAYEHKRSKNLLKYKPEDDDEGVIKKIHEGTGNWAGTAKTATILWKGKEFDATFKGTYEQGVERLKNPQDWEGQPVTFLFTGLTGLGIPNYARIDPDNCFKGDR
jgi:DNA ligase 1